jgi:carboxylesterase
MAVNTKPIWSSPPEPGELDAFRLGRGVRGCLLIHGFAGTPPEMRELGEFLATRGYAVMAPLLAGHGETPEAMARTRWQDWAASAEEAYAGLRRDCEQVFLCGQSLGGTLALHLAATHPDARGVISIGAMGSTRYFRDWRLRLIAILKYLRPWHIPDADCDLGDPEALQLLHSYARRPTVCIESLMQLLAVLEHELPTISAPALVVHGRNDRTVDTANAPFILGRLGSRDKQLVWFEKSGHAVTVDLEHRALEQTVLAWLDAH